MEMTTTDLRKRLENLQRRIIELKAEKKRDAKLKNEEIADVDDEIKETLDLLEDINTPD